MRYAFEIIGMDRRLTTRNTRGALKHLNQGGSGPIWMQSMHSGDWLYYYASVPIPHRKIMGFDYFRRRLGGPVRLP